MRTQTNLRSQALRQNLGLHKGDMGCDTHTGACVWILGEAMESMASGIARRQREDDAGFPSRPFRGQSFECHTTLGTKKENKIQISPCCIVDLDLL